jgi:dTDP-4-dehydrorhamnose reductase
VKVLITGSSGQVGRALLGSQPPHVEVRALTHAQLDISDAGAVRCAVADFQPALIINAAAYTAVDRAEDEPDRAMAINAIGAANLASSIRPVPTTLRSRRSSESD